MADTDAEFAPSAAAPAPPHMTLLDWLDDLTVRFLLNLPPSELSSIPRLCFQVEEAQWFYEDFVRPQNPTFPSLNLRQFLLILFQHCPLLSGFDVAHHGRAYDEFLAYKTRVPVRGAILMDDSMDQVLLVRGWRKGASWSFPRGKINKDEDDMDCAIREVYEETGYDVKAAGLVESNAQPDGTVKAINVTMRDQHMQLFIFRGVPLETHFAPRTRKEISKISWYNVKDLPGFKKQKGAAGHGQGQAQASKFYMVAPFLGELKKWVGQQRRDDNAAARAQHDRSLSASDVPQTGTTEDREDTEQGFTTDNGTEGLNRSADELKRLLSIGQPSEPAPPERQELGQPQASGLTTDLLTMLKGNHTSSATGTLPHTPLEQIDPRLPSKIPETPQAHIPRQPSVGFQQQQQTFPAFSQSPNRLQQQQTQHQFPGPPMGPFGHSPGYFGRTQQPTAPGLPPHMQQQQFQDHTRAHSLANFPPGYGMAHQFNNQANAAASSLHLYQQVQTPNFEASRGNGQQFAPQRQSFASPTAPLASPMHLTTLNQPHGPAFVHALQNSHVPLGSEKSIPEASKLPPPKLNAHSSKLLDVLKGVSSTQSGTPGPSSVGPTQRAGNQQQAALLDLFRKPSAAQQIPPKSTTEEAPSHPEPVSPALTDATVIPIPRHTEERPLASTESMQTLPLLMKGKAPLSSGSQANVPRPTANESSPQSARPKQISQTVQGNNTKQPSRPGQSVRSTLPEAITVQRPKSRGQLYDPSNPQKFTRASSTQGQRPEAESVMPQKSISQQTPRSPNPVSKAKTKPVAPKNANVVPQFSILQRPTSSSARSPAPQSPLRNEAPVSEFQPQVLRRSGSAENGPLHVNSQIDDLAGPGDEKRTHLLSLFNKGLATSASPSAQTTASTSSAVDLQTNDQRKTTLLGLFNGAGAPRVAKTPEPPPAPQLLPERKLSNQIQKPINVQQSSQQLLLSLFDKSSPSGAASPGTPISPFTLNPPITISTQVPDLRSRLGNMASIGSNGGGSGRQTPTSATPTMEAKGFMLDYLNGVVQKEGHRSAAKKT